MNLFNFLSQKQKCRKCGEYKPLSEFYKNQKRCKTCCWKGIKEWRLRNPDKVRTYKKRFRQKHKEAIALYYKTWYQKNGRKRIKKQQKAHWQIRQALREKQIVKNGICEICGSSYNVIAHHPNYNKPLKVIWVCMSCHKLIHLNNLATERDINKIKDKFLKILQGAISENWEEKDATK